jgi:hypothetical protein
MGIDGVLRREGWGLTVAGASSRYRRRVRAFERLVMTTRCLGWDVRFLYMEQALWKGGDCAVHMLLRSAVVAREGFVDPVRLARALGHQGENPALPDWVLAWIAADAGRPFGPQHVERPPVAQHHRNLARRGADLGQMGRGQVGPFAEQRGVIGRGEHRLGDVMYLDLRVAGVLEHVPPRPQDGREPAAQHDQRALVLGHRDPCPPQQFFQRFQHARLLSRRFPFDGLPIRAGFWPHGGAVEMPGPALARCRCGSAARGGRSAGTRPAHAPLGEPGPRPRHPRDRPCAGASGRASPPCGGWAPSLADRPRTPVSSTA